MPSDTPKGVANESGNLWELGFGKAAIVKPWAPPQDDRRSFCDPPPALTTSICNVPSLKESGTGVAVPGILAGKKNATQNLKTCAPPLEAIVRALAKSSADDGGKQTRMMLRFYVAATALTMRLAELSSAYLTRLNRANQGLADMAELSGAYQGFARPGRG